MGRALIFTIIFLTSGICYGQTITGRVVHVHDGDSFTIIGCDSIRHKVRLWGVDAPELKQPGGEHARVALQKMIMGNTVVLTVVAGEKYGRLLSMALVRQADNSVQNVNVQMLQNGYAWAYAPNANKKMQPRIAEYQRYMDNAISAHAGIWKEINNTPPWEYRKHKK